MNGGILPLVLLFAAIGLALSFTTARAAWYGATALAASALVLAFVPLPPNLTEPVLAGLLISTILTAALTYLPRELPRQWAVAAAINAGLWGGAMASISGMRGGLAAALPLSLLFIAGQWRPVRNYAIIIKVLASWIIAIASLAMFVSLVSTPGYKPDHME